MARYAHLPIYKKAMDRAICVEKSREVVAAKARWFRVVSTCLCCAFPVVTNGSAAADSIYVFHDEQGVAHFSNVPAGPRYRLFLHATTAPTPDAILGSPEVIVFAPPMVDRGVEFSVTILLAGGARVRGWLEFTFDPAVLTLVGATSHHDAPTPGSVRVKLPGGASKSFSAELQFLASGYASDSTSISLAHTSLVTDEGEPIVASGPSAAAVAVSSLPR